MYAECKLVEVVVASTDNSISLDQLTNFNPFFCKDSIRKYIKLLHNYMMCMLNMRIVKKKMLKSKETILDLVSPSDETLAILLAVNNHLKWSNIHKHENNMSHTCHTKRGGKFCKTKGCARFDIRWTTDGITLYSTALTFFHLAREDKTWDLLKEKCRAQFNEIDLKAGYYGVGLHVKIKSTKGDNEYRSAKVTINLYCLLCTRIG